MLLLNRYTYKKQRAFASGKVLWYCSSRIAKNCKAFAKSVGDIYIFGGVQHTHPPPGYKPTDRPMEPDNEKYVGTSRRGGEILHYQGQVFNLRTKSAAGKKTWCCKYYYNCAVICPVKIKTLGDDNENLNLIITDITSEANVQNESDDDVIEVVRDEAPIEILSDDEETELERSKLVTAVDEFLFADLPARLENSIDKAKNSPIDPLFSNTYLESSIDVTDCNTAQNEVTNNLEDEERSTIVNVTDLLSDNQKNEEIGLNLPHTENKHIDNTSIPNVPNEGSTDNKSD
ncbi:hypothetical protein RR48_05213 [Papilio machaon]|uniref:FLYWCH-type domain-containing protein n=1 Tax=Papilio machaon TaxID=76193 RepID=A0A0N0PC94_PAPMA|nr:hypothetical protein RR48_05213 [Papilio machaon]